MMARQGLYALLKANGTSVKDFSIRHGFSEDTVGVVIRRWWHRSDRKPHGGISKHILKTLRDEVAGYEEKANGKAKKKR